MKNRKIVTLIVFLMLISTLVACGEKGQDYFTGTIVEITDHYYVVTPDDEKLLDADASGLLLVPKETVQKRELDLKQGERVQIVYNEITKGIPKIDIVYAIYKESELR